MNRKQTRKLKHQERMAETAKRRKLRNKVQLPGGKWISRFIDIHFRRTVIRREVTHMEWKPGTDAEGRMVMNVSMTTNPIATFRKKNHALHRIYEN